MSEHKTPTETLQEIEYEISVFEREKLEINKRLYYVNFKINQLNERKKSLFNYLNSDSINQDKTE